MTPVSPARTWPGDEPHRRAGAFTWLLAVGILPLVQLGVLSGLFDASVLAERGGVLAHVIGASGDVVRAALPVLAAALLVGAARLKTLAPAFNAAFTSPRPWAALAAQLACFALLVVLSGRVFAAEEPGSALLVAWVTTGAAAAALWLVALIPRVIRRGPGWVLAGALAAGVGLGIVAAGAASITREWWEPLGRFTLWAVYAILRGLGFDAGAEAGRFLVGTPTFVVEITSYCSGYQGIGLMWAFLGAYLWLFRERLRFPQAFWLLPIGTVLVWLLNVLRIVLLVIIGSSGHEDIATQGFHYHAGTLLFCTAALGLGAWAGSSRLFSAALPERRGETFDNPTAAYLLPFVVILATALVTGSMSGGGFDALYGVRILTTAVVLWLVRDRLRDAGWRVSWSGALLGVAAFAIWIGLAGGTEGHGDVGAAIGALDPAARLSWIALRCAGAIVLVPLVEELAFRGYLARRLTATDFERLSLRAISWPAILASSAVFGVMHHDAVAGGLVGILYALAARRRGQLGDAVLAHAVTNALLAITVLATGRWALWQ
jgi:exosortase E/protease (VPEID-CTERM system)